MFFREPGTKFLRETMFFYKCLQSVGTDFEMISKYFPNRTRHHIKLKFKLEERHNPDLITKAMTLSLIDIADVEKEYLEVAQQAEEERSSKKRKPANPEGTKRRRRRHNSANTSPSKQDKPKRPRRYDYYTERQIDAGEDSDIGSSEDEEEEGDAEAEAELRAHLEQEGREERKPSRDTLRKIRIKQEARQAAQNNALQQALGSTRESFESLSLPQQQPEQSSLPQSQQQSTSRINPVFESTQSPSRQSLSLQTSTLTSDRPAAPQVSSQRTILPDLVARPTQVSYMPSQTSSMHQTYSRKTNSPQPSTQKHETLKRLLHARLQAPPLPAPKVAVPPMITKPPQTLKTLPAPASTQNKNMERPAATTESATKEAEFDQNSASSKQTNSGVNDDVDTIFVEISSHDLAKFSNSNQPPVVEVVLDEERCVSETDNAAVVQELMVPIPSVGNARKPDSVSPAITTTAAKEKSTETVKVAAPAGVNSKIITEDGVVVHSKTCFVPKTLLCIPSAAPTQPVVVPKPSTSSTLSTVPVSTALPSQSTSSLDQTRESPKSSSSTLSQSKRAQPSIPSTMESPLVVIPTAAVSKLDHATKRKAPIVVKNMSLEEDDIELIDLHVDETAVKVMTKKRNTPKPQKSTAVETEPKTALPVTGNEPSSQPDKEQWNEAEATVEATVEAAAEVSAEMTAKATVDPEDDEVDAEYYEENDEEGDSSDSENREFEFLTKAPEPTRFGRIPKSRKIADIDIESDNLHVRIPKSKLPQRIASSVGGKKRGRKKRVDLAENAGVSHQSDNRAAEEDQLDSPSSPESSIADSTIDEPQQSLPPGVTPGSFFVFKRPAPDDPTKELYEVFMVPPPNYGVTMSHNPDGSVGKVSVGNPSGQPPPSVPGTLSLLSLPSESVSLGTPTSSTTISLRSPATSSTVSLENPSMPSPLSKTVSSESSFVPPPTEPDSAPSCLDLSLNVSQLDSGTKGHSSSKDK